MITCGNSPLRGSFRTAPVSGFAALVCLAVSLLAALSPVFGESHPRLIEIRDENDVFQGKLVARSSDLCFLVDPFGELKQLPVSRMKSFTVLHENFKPAGAGEFRERLQKEFKGGYEVQPTSHFIVVGKRGRARIYASLFEEIYRQVESFYSIRGFRTRPPEMSLVAIVFASQQEFREYCERDQVLWSSELRGYYSLRTNRVALYDHPALPASVSDAEVISPLHRVVISATDLPHDNAASEVTRAMLSTIAGETANTIVHETTHQVGFNIGIHSRMAETPMWVIEGLATVMEAPGVRIRDKPGSSEKLNRERHSWFFGEYLEQHKPGDLAKLIASDDAFSSQALDAYCVSWALSYFLTENPARSRLFMKYLRLVGERPAFQKYTPEERLRDFHSVFGDIARLEVDFLRAMDRLESR